MQKSSRSLAQHHGAAYHHEHTKPQGEEKKAWPQRMIHRQHHSGAEECWNNQQLNHHRVGAAKAPETSAKDRHRDHGAILPAKLSCMPSHEFEKGPERLLPDDHIALLPDRAKDLWQHEGMEQKREETGRPKPRKKPAHMGEGIAL